MNRRVLVIDDDRDLCELIAQSLRNRQFLVDVANDEPTALEAIRGNDYDVIALDAQLGETDGIKLCARIVDNRPTVPVVIVTGHGDMETAIEAIRAGAHDFVTKPLAMDALALTLSRAIELRDLTEEVKRLRAATTRPRTDPMVGDSKPMRQVYQFIESVAAGDSTVLINGESGTGKELVARAIHDASPRRAAPFVAVNCAAVSPSLVESELFGHVKGAFTDARTSRTGLFVQASGGTLFLDEIGEMAAHMQAKLLRVLQERRVRPVGGDAEVPFDTRIVAATNKDLETEVEEGRFREDLFYRVHVVQILVPPLRSRGKDILELANQFLADNASACKKNVRGISRAVAAKLLAYDWPGNVRELQNCIEHAVALTAFDELSPDDLPEKISNYEHTRIVIDGRDPDEMPTLSEVEHRYLRRVLQAVGGNKAQAARVLGVDRRTLYRKLERLEVATNSE